MKIKRILKQAIFDQYWTFLFTTINFYMCTLYYFYFLSSRVIQLTPYFMILLVLIFIVNQNFKLLNWHSILLLFSFALLPFCFLYFFLSYYCLCYCPIIILATYLLLLLFTHLFTYLFIYIILSISFPRQFPGWRTCWYVRSALDHILCNPSKD